MTSVIPRRLLTAAIMLAMFFAALYFDPLRWLAPVLIGACGVLCLFEIGQLICLKNCRFPYLLCFVFLFFFLADGYLAGLRHALPILSGLIIMLLTWRVLICDYQNLAAEVGAAFLATVYIGLPMGMATALCRVTDSSGAPIGMPLMFYQAAVIFCGDTAAFLVGSRWGKRPFFPRISPRKTLEGAAAALATSVAVAVFVTLLLPSLRTFFGFCHGALLGLILGLMAPFGDLAESAFKRDANRKDSGSDLTGHGGFLDMFDSMLFGLPIQFFYIQLVLANTPRP